LAARHGVHRRTVKQALLSPVPPAKRSPVGRPAPKLGPYRAVIDGWLEADRKAPRKQRHTAKRIHQRLVDEHGADVAETTVRQYVRGRKRAMGWPIGEVFVPQVHAPGMEAEVDWGEAEVVLAGVATMVHLFVMRASFSGAAFCQASLVETQQAFLELHAQAFAWFGGVFPSLRFDNLKSAVKKVLKGRRRVESARSSHRVDSPRCSVGLPQSDKGSHADARADACPRDHEVSPRRRRESRKSPLARRHPTTDRTELDQHVHPRGRKRPVPTSPELCLPLMGDARRLEQSTRPGAPRAALLLTVELSRQPRPERAHALRRRQARDLTSAQGASRR
jgi:hypothetical protein